MMNYTSGRWDWGLSVYADLRRIKTKATLSENLPSFSLLSLGGVTWTALYVHPACRLSELSREAAARMRPFVTLDMKYLKVCLLL